MRCMHEARLAKELAAGERQTLVADNMTLDRATTSTNAPGLCHQMITDGPLPLCAVGQEHCSIKWSYVERVTTEPILPCLSGCRMHTILIVTELLLVSSMMLAKRQ